MLIDFDPFPANSVLFDQLPGLVFPTTPRTVTTAGGERALSNAQPGEEFNNQPLRIDFAVGQGRVALKAGLTSTSFAPVDATLRAFDQAGAQIAQDGPRQVGPGPAEADVLFEVEDPATGIRRVELAYSGAFAELIDDLEFDVEGAPAQPDVQPPDVSILRPENGATLTGESFIFEAEITEDRRLSEVLINITGAQGSVTFPVSFSGQAPNFKLGPFRTQPLALGPNDITVTARDLAGNEGQDTVTVNRVPLEAILTVIAPESPVVLRRIPVHNIVDVRLEETFPGSLDGRGEIDIVVAGPQGINGRVKIRDFLNQPQPQASLEIFASPSAQYGSTLVTLEAIEVETGRTIASTDMVASVVPANPFECGAQVPLYIAATPEEFRAAVEAGLDAALAEKPNVSAVTPLQLTFATNEIRIFRRFHVDGPIGGFPSAKINMSATIVRNPDIPFANLADAQNLDEGELPFTYRPFRVNAAPSIPVVDILTAIAWVIAQAKFESQFSEEVRLKLIRGFNAGIFERLAAVNELAHLFLRETRINEREFLFGFCIPGNNFPQPSPE